MTDNLIIPTNRCYIGSPDLNDPFYSCITPDVFSGATLSFETHDEPKPKPKPKPKIPKPKKILYHGVATIVFWDDGTKTVVKRAANDPDNRYNAFCSALAIKLYGNNSRVNKYVKSGVTQK